MKSAIITVSVLIFCCFVGCKQKTKNGKGFISGMAVDTIENHLNDSIRMYHNPTRICASLKRYMSLATDSVSYYRMLSLYINSYLFINSDMDSLEKVGKKVLNFSLRQSDGPGIPDLQARAYHLLGNIYIYKRQNDSAVVYYLKSYRVGNLKDMREHANTAINLGDAYCNAGKFVDASFYFRRVVRLCDSAKLPFSFRYPAYSGLGKVYAELGNYDLSNYYYNEVGKYYNLMSDDEKHYYLVSRGNMCYFRQDYRLAIKYFEKSLLLVEGKASLVFFYNLSLADLGELYVLTNRLNLAEKYLNKSYAFYKKCQNETAMYYIETQMMALALKRGNLALVKKYKTLTAQHHTYLDLNVVLIHDRLLQQYYVNIGDYRNAYSCQLRNIQLNDSVSGSKIRLRVAEMEMRFMQSNLLMHKEIKIKDQNSKVKVLQLTIYIWGVFFALIIVSIIFAYNLIRKKHALDMQQQLNRITRYRMENIHNRISPHFTFNILNRELSQVEEPEKIRRDLKSLVKILRRSLELAERLSISLAEELDFVKTYVHLEEGRFEDGKFSMEINIDGQMDLQHIQIPSMIVQIPVENAIKHGLLGLIGEKRIIIFVHSSGHGTAIEICDNGRGYNPQVISANRGTGTGLKVLYQTIQLLNDKNKQKIIVKISNISDGTITGTLVSIFVPQDYIFEL
jgi:tetratricopeptide (TPR) repeat protein